MNAIENHLNNIERSEFPISIDTILDGLRAEGRKVKEGDPYNDILDRLADEGMVETIKPLAQNLQWKRTNYGNQMFNYLNT